MSILSNKHRVEILDPNNLEYLNKIVRAAAEEANLEEGDRFQVTIAFNKIPKPYFSRWTQSPVKTAFRRNTCPICGSKIPEYDGRDGFPEMVEECPVGKANHYRLCINLFGDWLHVGGNQYDRTKDLKKIDELLDEIGNKEYI